MMRASDTRDPAPAGSFTGGDLRPFFSSGVPRGWRGDRREKLARPRFRGHKKQNVGPSHEQDILTSHCGSQRGLVAWAQELSWLCFLYLKALLEPAACPDANALQQEAKPVPVDLVANEKLSQGRFGNHGAQAPLGRLPSFRGRACALMFVGVRHIRLAKKSPATILQL